MNDLGPLSAREALLAEALGDVAALLDRIDAVVHALNAAATTANDACANIDAKAVAFDARVAALVDASKRHLVSHVATKTAKITRAAGETQLQAIRAELHALIRSELAASLERARHSSVGGAHRHLRCSWWAHIVTAICASTIAGMIVSYLLSN
jgi:hypothetical protein